MNCVVLDIDDTLISTDRRIQRVWNEILGRGVPLNDVESLSAEQIFLKYASKEQKARVKDFQRRFWDIVLCLDRVGVELLGLHEPIPFAADVLREWSETCEIVYLTGRTENTRDITLREFEEFGFPTANVDLVMFSLDDYARARGENPEGQTLVDAKSRLFSSIAKRHNVVRVVDDYPGYFRTYSQFKVADRIGFLRSKKYSYQRYIDEGATRVVESWKELLNDPPPLGQAP